MQVHISRFIVASVVLSGLLFSQGLFAQEAQEAQEESKPKFRTITTRDPRTGRTVTQQIPVDPNNVSAGSETAYRTVTTRDPRTGRTITQQVPASPEAAIKLRVQRYRERCEISDEQWNQVEPLLTKVVALQTALRPSPAPRFRTAVADSELNQAPQDAPSPAIELKSAYEALTEAVRHPEATDEEIAQKIQAYTQKRQEVETELQAAKLELIETLSTRQQAQLILEGVL